MLTLINYGIEYEKRNNQCTSWCIPCSLVRRPRRNIIIDVGVWTDRHAEHTTVQQQTVKCTQHCRFIDPGSWWFANKLALTMIGNSDSHSLIGPRWIVCVTSLASYRGTEQTSRVSPSQEITNVRWANVLFTGEDLPLSLGISAVAIAKLILHGFVDGGVLFWFLCGIGRTCDIVGRQPSSATEVYCAANCIWMGSGIREWRGLLAIPFYCSKCLVYLSLPIVGEFLPRIFSWRVS